MSTTEDIAVILADRRLKSADKVTAIIDYFDEDETVYAAEPLGSTHVAIETVEIYGLRIGVDANGRAARVEFPDGATV